MISLYDLLDASNGQLFGRPAAQIFTDICLDARVAHDRSLFVARRTEIGDTHQYIEEAIRRGASGVLCIDPPEVNTDGTTVILTRDPDAALMRWAHLILGKMGTKVIGVTGSSGKSITVDMISRVLRSRYSVLEDTGDTGGILSVPITLAKLTLDHEFVVLNLRTTHPGEMADMVETIQPEVGVIMNVDDALDGFMDRKQLADEFKVLVEYLSPYHLAVLNYDSDHVRAMASDTRAHVQTMGIESFGADLMAFNTVVGPTGTGFDLRYGDDRFLGRWIPLLGRQTIYSALATIVVALRYDISIDDSLQALTELMPLSGRMNPLAGVNNCLLIDDTYNANMLSTRDALDWLDHIRSTDHRTILVIGDMEETGSHSQASHRQVGLRAADIADIIVTQGAHAALIGRAALDEGKSSDSVFITYSAHDTVHTLTDLNLGDTDVVLIKGGIAARMEQVVKELLENKEDQTLLVRQDAIWDDLLPSQHTRPSWVEIDTTALGNNVRLIRHMTDGDVTIMAVVKANGYGHGSVTAARTALVNGAGYLGVASTAEAMELRSAGVSAPILVLSFAPVYTIRQALQNDFSVSVFDIEMARGYSRVAREIGLTLKVHVKVDTGMGRLGILASEALNIIRQIAALPHISVEGVYTHFSSADSDDEYTRQQLTQFEEVIRLLKNSGLKIKYFHAANSAGVLMGKDAHLNMVRPGLILYGLNPLENKPQPEGFRPVMTWKTVVAQVRTFPPDYPIGYGNTYRTSSAERIAILPVGYADGFRRGPTNWQCVLVHGKRAPLVGRVSMEKSAINVTEIPGVSIGDEVVLLGRQGDDEITADEIAGWLGTINYEIVTNALPRVLRQ